MRNDDCQIWESAFPFASPHRLGGQSNPRRLTYTSMSRAVQKGDEAAFWRDHPSVVGYFAPGIAPRLDYLRLDSKKVMRAFGEQL